MGLAFRTPLILAPLTLVMYSLLCLRISIFALSSLTKAAFCTALLGKCLNWFRMIWPCTTAKRSTRSTLLEMNDRPASGCSTTRRMTSAKDKRDARASELSRPRMKIARRAVFRTGLKNFSYLATGLTRRYHATSVLIEIDSWSQPASTTHSLICDRYRRIPCGSVDAALEAPPAEPDPELPASALAGESLDPLAQFPSSSVTTPDANISTSWSTPLHMGTSSSVLKNPSEL
mmetsp:Transcript_8828/g.26815  ORF Transcript_8828/g.26815 Transcript_8828/m.26815 type:complete len:232 (+) Transcript_8828:3229-3924(+)